MSTQTSNLQLIKPDINDYFDISVQNTNMDIIDETIKEQEDTITELKKSVSDGKSLVAGAITDKGVNTATDATFATMAKNISNISTGTDTSDANATEEQILSGAIAYGVEGKLVGAMVNNSTTTEHIATALLDSTNSELEMIIPKTGYYTVNNKLKATFATIASLIGLTSSKLAGGNTILGISGNSNVVDTSAGTATASQILGGQVAFVDGVKITGTMIKKVPDYGDQLLATILQYGAGSEDGIEYLYCGITNNAYYEGVNFIRTSAESVANQIGLQAWQIVAGNTVLGVAGTGGGKKYATGVVNYVSTSLPSTATIYYGSGSYSTTSIPQITLPIDFTPSVVKLNFTITLAMTINYTAVITDDSYVVVYDSLNSGVSANIYYSWMYMNGSYTKLMNTTNKTVMLPYAGSMGVLNTTAITYEAWE